MPRRGSDSDDATRPRGRVAVTVPVPEGPRADLVRQVSERHAGQAGALLPVLHAVQEELGHLETDDLRVVADVLNLSVADVHGVVSFYDDFRTTAPAPHQLRLCRAEACRSVGAQELYDATVARFAGRDDVEVHHVFCLGLCPAGPSGMLDGVVHARLDEDRVAELTAGWELEPGAGPTRRGGDPV